MINNIKQNYYNKYIKYKLKYVQHIHSSKNFINSHQGGSVETGLNELLCNNLLFFHNKVGECWNIGIDMMFIFGDTTKTQVQALMDKCQMINVIKQYYH